MLVPTALLLVCKERRLGYPNCSRMMKGEFQRGHTHLHHLTTLQAKTDAHHDLKVWDVTSDNLKQLHFFKSCISVYVLKVFFAAMTTYI